jgi:hypothetical protein
VDDQADALGGRAVPRLRTRVGGCCVCVCVECLIGKRVTVLWLLH